MSESQTFIKKSLCAAVAQHLIIAAIERAKMIEKPMVIAIVDESGQLKAFHRMDGAALLSIEVAQNKAYSAVANAWGHATHEIYTHISKDPATLIGIPQIPRYTVFGGGYPIRIDGEIVGAIGISGGNVTQDRDVAEAALSTLKG